MNVLLLERDDRARTTLEMVLALRGHHVERCRSHQELIERLERATAVDFVLYAVEAAGDSVSERLSEVRTAGRASDPLLVAILDEQDIAGLTPGALEPANQVLIRPLNIEMLDLQFETFEYGARERRRDQAPPLKPRFPAGALARLADRAIELGLLLDAEGRIQFTTAGIEFVTGHDPRSYHGRSALSLIHPDDRSNVGRLLTASGEGGSIRARILGDGQQVNWFDLKITRFPSRPDDAAFVLIGQRSPTQPGAARESSGYGDDLVAHIDASGAIQFRTTAFARLLDDGEAHTETRLEDFILDADRDLFHSCLRELPEAVGGQRSCYVRVRAAGERWRTLELNCTNMLGVPGLDAIVVNAEDITHRKSLEQRLMRRAFLDTLTDLPNRGYFLNRLERALNRSAEGDTRIAVLFLDLDRFKLINDSLGHEVGDQLLVAVGQRLKTAVRPGDIVARFGGDEFIVLLEQIAGEEEATAVAERIIEDMRAPLAVGRHDISISTSVGIALDDPPPSEANLLIRNADIALYRAKELGPSRYAVFDESMARRVIERLELENELRHALERDQLTIEFLPELDLGDGRLAALEVLTRWRHPERGEVDPATFLDVAEESGLIIPIGRWVLNEACSHVQRWRMRHTSSSGLMISVNMSVREFQQPDLVDFITTTLERHEIPPARIRIEIDERSLTVDPDDTLEKVQTLRDLGVTFAIDNFGRGISSLSIFTRFAFDMLKVDRQFISGNERLVRNLSVVRAITSLAHALGMRVCAEGIETREQLARVRAAGCDFGQGYLFTSSLEANTTEALFLTARINDAA